MPHRARLAAAPSHVPQARHSPNTGSTRPGAGARSHGMLRGCSPQAAEGSPTQGTCPQAGHPCPGAGTAPDCSPSSSPVPCRAGQGPGKALARPRQRALSITPLFPPRAAPPPRLLHHSLPAALLAWGSPARCPPRCRGLVRGAGGSTPRPPRRRPPPAAVNTQTRGFSAPPGARDRFQVRAGLARGRRAGPCAAHGRGLCSCPSPPCAWPRQPWHGGVLRPPRRAAPRRVPPGQDPAPRHGPRGPAGAPGSRIPAEGSLSPAPLALAHWPAHPAAHHVLPHSWGAQSAPHPPEGPRSPRAVADRSCSRHGGGGRAPGSARFPAPPGTGTAAPARRRVPRPTAPLTRGWALLCPTHRSGVPVPGQPSHGPRQAQPAQLDCRAAVSQAVCYRKERRAAISFQNVSCLRRAASPRLPAASSITAACLVPTEGAGLAPPPCPAPHSCPVPALGTTSARSGSVGLSPWSSRQPGTGPRAGTPGRDAGAQHGGRQHGPTCTPGSAHHTPGAEPAQGTLGWQ